MLCALGDSIFSGRDPLRTLPPFWLLRPRPLAARGRYPIRKEKLVNIVGWKDGRSGRGPPLVLVRLDPREVLYWSDSGACVRVRREKFVAGGLWVLDGPVSDFNILAPSRATDKSTCCPSV